MTRIDLPLVFVVILGACAGAPPRPPPDACVTYAGAVRAPLARMQRAADAFADRAHGSPDEGARASLDLAASLEDERLTLAALRPQGDDLRGAHLATVASLAGMADALRQLAAVLEARDESRREAARQGLMRASRDFGRAVKLIRTACPDL